MILEQNLLLGVLLIFLFGWIAFRLIELIVSLLRFVLFLIAILAFDLCTAIDSVLSRIRH